MKLSTVSALLNLAFIAYAAPPSFDPSGDKNVGNGVGGQFIGGQCLSNADCASNCCAKPTGICSGPGAQFEDGKLGCGFGSDAATTPPSVDNAVVSAAFAGGPPFDSNGEKNVGNGVGQQFITGQCLSNADCASRCCAGPSGICSGVGAALQAGKTGCGFSSNKKLRFF